MIERALDRLLRGRSSVIIAHRLATVRRADVVLVVERGRIVQRGAPADLLAVDGPFRRLASSLHTPERPGRPPRRRPSNPVPARGRG